MKFKKTKNKLTPVLLAVLLIVQMFLPVQIFLNPPRIEVMEIQAAPTDWLDGWDYRTPIEVDGNTEDLTDYQVQITLQGSNSSAANYVDFDKVLTGGADLRFTDDDKITEIDFWIEEWVDDSGIESAIVWVEVSSVLTAGTKTVYVYYGRGGVSSGSDGDETFEFFDDAENGSASDKWEAVVGSPSFSYETLYSTDGIWYSDGDYYHGPMTTYTAKHRPMAIYVESQNKTYFVYGSYDNKAMISYHNHSTGAFVNPVEVAPLGNNDAHRNPTIFIDEDGYIYVFYGSHGDTCYTKKSINPYNINLWESKASIADHSYPQAWQLKSGEIIHFYRGGDKSGYYRTSTDGTTSWLAVTELIDFSGKWIYMMTIAESGDYTRRVHMTWTAYDSGTATRKHFYYAYSDDGGITWKKANDTEYTLPIGEATAEKVFDSGDNQVHSSDIQVDSAGNPYILISTGTGTNPNSWAFKLVKYKDGSWNSYTITDTCDHQFDTGALVIFNDNDFRAYLPSVTTQDSQDGGDIEEQKSTDQGETWVKVQDITTGSSYSHNYIRTVYNSHSDFRVFWGYGDSTNPPSTTDVTLYFYGENQASAQTIYGNYRNALLVSGSSADDIIRAKNLDLGDMILEADVLPGGSNWKNSAFNIRVNESGHSYNARANHATSNSSRIYKNTDSWNLIASGDAKDITDWHKWTLKIHNYDIEFFWDDTSVISTTDVDSSINSGSIGARVYSSTIKLDDIRVRQYTSPEPTLTTTSAFRGYDKIFTGITNTISSTDYVSYSAEPTVGNSVEMTITPASSSIDASITTWNTSSPYYKKWTETGNGNISTAHTVGDLSADTYYTVWYTKDGGSKTRLTTGQADGSSQIAFTYDQGYSDVIFEIEEDETAPAAFELSSPSDNSWTSDNTPTLAWNASSDSESGLAKYQLWINDVLDKDNIDSSATSTTPTSALTDASYTWYIKAIDNAGNSRQSTSTWTIGIDTTGSTGTISNGSGDPTNDTTPTLNLSIADTGIGTDSAQMRFSCDNSTWSTWENYATPKTDFNIKTGAGCADADGDKTIYAQFRDSLENAGSSYNTGSFVLDTASSFATFDSGAPADPTNQNTTDITVAGTDITHYKYKLDDGSYGSETAIAVHLVLSDLTDGEHTLSLIGKDTAGNWQAEGSATTHTWTVDITSPVISLVSPANNSSTGDNNPTLTWSASDATSGIAKYQLYVDGSLDTDNISSSATSVTPTDSLSCDSHTWYIRAYDNVDNYTDSSTFNLIISCGSGFISSSPPIISLSPNQTFEIITINNQSTINLSQVENAYQIAISITPDFEFVSWEPYQENVVLPDAKKVYLKFRSETGGVSEVYEVETRQCLVSTNFLNGSLIRAINNYEVYIINNPSTGSGQAYKRHILDGEIFNFYGHLNWDNVQEVNSSLVDNYQESYLVRASNDYKVYKIINNKKHWLNITVEEFIELGYKWEEVYVVNEMELGWYEIQ